MKRILEAVVVVWGGRRSKLLKVCKRDFNDILSSECGEEMVEAKLMRQRTSLRQEQARRATVVFAFPTYVRR